jgi:hypothetical protein
MGEVVPFRPRQRGTGVGNHDDVASAAGKGMPVRHGLPASSTGRLNDRPRREPLWREVTGAVLKQERHRQRKTLAEVAARAGMSVQYLSELERGRKEASSEMLAAACGSLGLSLADFLQRSAAVIASPAARPSGPVLLAA